MQNHLARRCLKEKQHRMMFMRDGGKKKNRTERRKRLRRDKPMIFFNCNHNADRNRVGAPCMGKKEDLTNEKVKIQIQQEQH